MTDPIHGIAIVFGLYVVVMIGPHAAIAAARDMLNWLFDLLEELND